LFHAPPVFLGIIRLVFKTNVKSEQSSPAGFCKLLSSGSKLPWSGLQQALFCSLSMSNLHWGLLVELAKEEVVEGLPPGKS
jgi:hypothetical protein